MNLKKLLLSATILIASGSMLVACSNKKDAKATTDSKTESVLTEKHEQAFKGKVISLSEHGLRVEVTDNIGTAKQPAFKSGETVVLLAKNAELSDKSGKTLKISDFKAGDKIQTVLSDKPIMTMSLPPQIPGNSIKEIIKL